MLRREDRVLVVLVVHLVEAVEPGMVGQPVAPIEAKFVGEREGDIVAEKLAV